MNNITDVFDNSLMIGDYFIYLGFYQNIVLCQIIDIVDNGLQCKVLKYAGDTKHYFVCEDLTTYYDLTRIVKIFPIQLPRKFINLLNNRDEDF